MTFRIREISRHGGYKTKFNGEKKLFESRVQTMFIEHFLADHFFFDISVYLPTLFIR